MEQMGGLLPPGGPNMPTYIDAPPGGGGPIIAVDTHPEAFERDGIVSGGGRSSSRRTAFRAPMPSMAGGGAMMGFPQAQSQQGVLPTNVNVMVNKME
jgi:hypothetical protein